MLVIERYHLCRHMADTRCLLKNCLTSSHIKKYVLICQILRVSSPFAIWSRNCGFLAPLLFYSVRWQKNTILLKFWAVANTTFFVKTLLYAFASICYTSSIVYCCPLIMLQKHLDQDWYEVNFKSVYYIVYSLNIIYICNMHVHRSLFNNWSLSKIG